MGFACPLKQVFSFIYKAKLGKLFEYEFDHVFVARFNGLPQANKDEVEDWKWISPDDLAKDIKAQPEKYAYWFKKVFAKVLEHAK